MATSVLTRRTALIATVVCCAAAGLISGTPASAVQRVTPVVRDHGPKPIVRDHTSKPIVRDHRTPPKSTAQVVAPRHWKPSH